MNHDANNLFYVFLGLLGDSQALCSAILCESDSWTASQKCAGIGDVKAQVSVLSSSWKSALFFLFFAAFFLGTGSLRGCQEDRTDQSGSAHWIAASRSPCAGPGAVPTAIELRKFFVKFDHPWLFGIVVSLLSCCTWTLFHLVRSWRVFPIWHRHG